MLFGRRSKWNIRQMCDELSVSADFLKRKIRPLVNQGLLQELDGEIYEFIESQERNFDQEELIVEEETVAEEERISEQTSSSNIWIYERYIYGILESFQALPLERIHKLLKVFVINPRYDKTEYELNGLLTNLVQQQKLQCTNGLFMVNKSAGVVSEFLHEDFFHRKDFPNAASYFQPQKYFRSLESKSLGHLLAYSPEVSSTQDVARSLFESLNLKNVVVVAESQTKGRGRRTNQWQTEFGSLAFSTVCSYSLYSTRTPSSVKGTVQLQPWRSVSFIQYLVALAIVEVVKDDATWKCLPLRIKWPNDLYLDDQKVGGVLCEGTVWKDELTLIIGVGLNVNNSHPTTCLSTWLQRLLPKDTSAKIDRECLLARLMSHFEDMYDRFLQDGFQQFLPRFLSHWLHSGQRLQLFSAKQEKILGYAFVENLSEEGNILVRDEQGRLIPLAPDLSSLDWHQGRAIIREK
ncbi:Anaphase-promoting complex subunit 2 [Galdieria sulphuraria]|nr:Anaphase-promoting complex subunit 2 [Galdieria sulphuraria]